MYALQGFGQDRLKVSVATVGTWAIGGSGWGAVDRQDSITAIRSMLDNDVNIVDTAPIYGCGYSEEVVGEAIKGYDREKLIISTKCGLVWGEGAPKGGRDVSGKSIMKEIDDSLRRLGVDYIDIYHVHKPDYLGTPFEDTMSAMMKLKESGKIRHIGLSNFSIEQTEECMKYGDVEVIQPPFSMIDQRERSVLEFAKAARYRRDDLRLARRGHADRHNPHAARLGTRRTCASCSTIISKSRSSRRRRSS